MMFDYCMSLGWYCATASSLSKYGLRSFSGVFDWCFAELEGVLKLIQNDFYDFLDKNNIQISGGSNENISIIDKKYGLTYNHEIKKNFEEEYDAVIEKYNRRIDKFREIFNNGTICFVRTVRSNEEIDYIIREKEYIDSVIKKGNKKNEIIFLIPKYMNMPDNFGYKYFVLNINCYQGNYRIALRGLFDTNYDIGEYLVSNYDCQKLKDNLIFDLKHELYEMQKYHNVQEVEKRAILDVDRAWSVVHERERINESRVQRLLTLINIDFEKIILPLKVDIYGAGDIGKVLYNKIKNRCKIDCFIDSNPIEEMYDIVPIVRVDDYMAQNDKIIVVIPTYAFDAIREKLCNYCGVSEECILRLEEFVLEK